MDVYGQTSVDERGWIDRIVRTDVDGTLNKIAMDVGWNEMKWTNGNCIDDNSAKESASASFGAMACKKEENFFFLLLLLLRELLQGLFTT
jgi:hypothetical protein